MWYGTGLWCSPGRRRDLRVSGVWFNGLQKNSKRTIGSLPLLIRPTSRRLWMSWNILYTGMASRCRFIMPCLLRCRHMQTSRYNMLMCFDISMATENVHTYSSRSETFCGLTAQEIRAYLVIVVSLFEPMVASPLLWSEFHPEVFNLQREL